MLDVGVKAINGMLTLGRGQRMGLVGMIRSMIEACDIDLSTYAPTSIDALRALLPRGLMRHDRGPDDAASIVEIWV